MVVVLAGTASMVAIVVTTGSVRALTLMLSLVATVTILALVAIGTAWALRIRRSANEWATRLTNLERRREALSAHVSRNEQAIAAMQVSSASPAPLERASGAGSTPGMLDMTASLVALGRAQGLELTDFLSQQQAAERVRAAADTGRVLEALPFLDAFPEVVRDLSRSEARTLLKGLRRLGYIGHSVAVIEEIAARFGNPADARAADLYASELVLYRGEVDLDIDLPALDAEPRSDVVLHVVGKALPEKQSGYTLRTQYTVEAQRRLGLEPVVVVQAGASDRAHRYTETYEHHGIRYYLLGGPQRGTVPWDEWLRENVIELAEVVRLVRPAAIHTHSDFMNAMIALPVARAYGIPLVNETRGFWEESWLSRTATAEGWDDLDDLEVSHGLPDMYRLRVEREAQTRSESDAVVTLARVMRDYIERVGAELGLPAPAISIAPNSVQIEEFPVSPPDEALREELGLAADGIVVGYISSIVEYEGIDTLVRSMFELESAIDAALQLESTRIPDALSIEQQERPVGIHAGRAEAEAPTNGRPSSPLAALRETLAVTGQALSATVEAHPADSQADTSGIGSMEEMTSRSTILDGLVEKLRGVHPHHGDDTLRAFSEALITSVKPFHDTPISLMIVGDGAELIGLKRLAQDLGIKNVLFTGRVPHDRVLEYYGLIDLFVVPRKRAAVTDLVTPLKPFEAMSTGRPCVFSDVRALAEIAEDCGAVELFRADDHHDLATTIATLLADPDRLAWMSRAGAEWVRNERTWDRNARVYSDLYRSLGVALAESSQIAATKDGRGN